MPERLRLRGHARAALGGLEVAVAGRGLLQEAAQRHRLLDALREGVRAMGADEAVGIMLGRQEQELDRAGVAGPGQGGLERLARGAPSRVVAVEAEHHRIGETEQQPQMVGGAGRAQGGDRLREAELGQRDHVHIALGHQAIAGLADRAAGLEQAVQLMALVEDRGLGRVQVLGLALVQHPAAKADAFALDVADREHDPVAKAVVALGRPGFLARARWRFLGRDHESGLDQLRALVVGQHGGQEAPALGRIAQAEGLGDLPRQAAALEVVLRALGLAQLLVVAGGHLVEQVVERGLLLALLGGAGALLRAQVFLRHLQAGLLRQVLDRLDEADAGVLHQEADRVAMLAAAEAMEELLGRADAEGGRFLAVEGAQPHEVGATLLELHIATDDLDDVDARKEFLDERLRYGHGAIFADAALRCPQTENGIHPKIDAIISSTLARRSIPDVDRTIFPSSRTVTARLPGGWTGLARHPGRLRDPDRPGGPARPGGCDPARCGA